MQENQIELRKVNDPEFNSLPRGVTLIVLGDKLIFVRRLGARFVPLPEEEQDKLRQKHIL